MTFVFPDPQVSELAFALALLRAPGVGPVRYTRLVERFGSPQQVFTAHRDDLAETGLPAPALDYLEAPNWDIVKGDLAWLEQPANYLIDYHHPNYPALLKQIPQPPPLLFVHGNPGCLGNHQIAIVGTRNPTNSGKETAYQFARHLATTGIVITSGLAVGIDAEAHRGALAAEGQTVAIMATGLDKIYPARHRSLANAIGKQGALVSELPLGTPPLAEHFPRRNRIISGLTLGVLVVEAALRSGSLITAHQALEQGREVFAIPGSIHNPVAKGCHSLIRQGAKLVETAADILEELGPLAAAATTDNHRNHLIDNLEPQQSNPDPGEAGLDPDYQRLLQSMDGEVTSIDILVERCGLTAEIISSMLLILELQGWVSPVPGGFYTRIKK